MLGHRVLKTKKRFKKRTLRSRVEGLLLSLSEVRITKYGAEIIQFPGFYV